MHSAELFQLPEPSKSADAPGGRFLRRQPLHGSQKILSHDHVDNPIRGSFVSRENRPVHLSRDGMLQRPRRPETLGRESVFCAK
jgi:hypothetical protein